MDNPTPAGAEVWTEEALTAFEWEVSSVNDPPQRFPREELQPERKMATVPVTGMKRILKIQPQDKPNQKVNSDGSAMFVNNLCFSVRCKRLKQVFQQAGTVEISQGVEKQ